ncbi:MAG: hypothetical protein OXG15_03620 [Gammaproteobacteria bacterium]|nr:hypothetical protein [Gammaproteobacteria bacterium]
MKLLTSSFIAAVLLTTSGCATQPKNIPPAEVSSVRYRLFSCADLHNELNLAIKERDSYIQEQLNDRSRDIKSNTFFMPGSGAMNTDHEHEVAESKGKVIAIERELEDRCSTAPN